MARVQVAADALHLKPTRLRVLSSYKRTSGPVLDYLLQPYSLSTLSISHLPLPQLRYLDARPASKSTDALKQ